jgi:perosamine synthetase
MVSIQNTANHVQCETACAEFVPFHVPTIGDEEIAAVVAVLRSGWLTTGSKVREFEEQFGRFVGSRHALAVNSCTAALHLALEAVGTEEGDEVIVPTMTFAATAEVVLYLKARPVLIDCRPDTLNLDLDRMGEAITNKTRAVIPVHVAGLPCPMERITETARNAGIKVIEDAAHALPARSHGQLIGTFGDLTCFSFYATKTITTGEGGMVTTCDDDYAARMRVMSLHGISQDAWKRYTSEGSWYYEILSPGYKYNLTDIAAAIGIEQLKRCDLFWQARNRIAKRYDAGFADLPEIRVPARDTGMQHAWHLYVIQLELDRLKITRNDFMEALREKNIGASVHFIPLHLHPYYRDKFGYKPGDFPVASAVYGRIISLPIFPKMSDHEIDRVIDAVREIARENRR